MPQQTQLTGWRLKVRDWLELVINQQYQYLNAGFSDAAIDFKSQFPKSFLVMLAAQLVKPLATWLVKSALKDAATDLGISLNGATLDFLADLAVDAMVAA